MQTKFETIKNNFFINLEINDFIKKFYIKADEVVFCTIFKKRKNDLILIVEIFGWSNKYQKPIPINNSVYAIEFVKSDTFNYEQFLNKYINICKNFFSYLKDLKYFWQYKELFHHLKNPMIMYHYKLINTFTEEELKKIICIFDFSTPLLNICNFQHPQNRLICISKIFRPHYFNGCYFLVGKSCSNGIEISVDLDESDEAVIECNEQKITKTELLHLLKN